MAGLYIRELVMRADARRILIVAPGSLVEQWRDELFEKFGLEFHILPLSKKPRRAAILLKITSKSLSASISWQTKRTGRVVSPWPFAIQALCRRMGPRRLR